MKRRRIEHEEKRRPLVEMNLIDEARPRLGVSRKGCLSFLTPVMLGVAALLIFGLGLR